MEPSGWNGIAKLEASSEGDQDIDVAELVKYYHSHFPDTPLSQLLEDMHKQALVWSNIIERLKAGDTPDHIKSEFRDRLQLIPENIDFPNPNESRLLNKAINKVSKYRRAMVTFVRNWGARFLHELRMEVGLTVGLGVELGFPPAVVLTIEDTYTIGQERWGAQAGGP
jgi:hypothetical protein